MNIFYLDNDVKKCAEMHVDKHVVKMILEYAQLLSTAHRVLDGTIGTTMSKSGRNQKTYILQGDIDSDLYRATHINHPSAIWVRQSKANYQWLYRLWIALLDEYTYRYGKIHASQRLNRYLMIPPNNIADKPFTEPTLAMPDEYKIGNSVESYKNYYNGAKSHMFSWKKREQPEWIKHATI